MSQSERDDFLEKFDVNEALEIIDKATKRGAGCIYCGSNAWMTELRTETLGPNEYRAVSTPAFVMKDPRAHWGSAPHIPVVAMTCMTCGHLRLHNYSYIMNILRPKFAESVDD